jgi:hypothetical protein
MLFEKSDKGEIGMRVALLKNVLEIASRLVSVNDQNEVKWRVGRGHSGSLL